MDRHREQPGGEADRPAHTTQNIAPHNLLCHKSPQPSKDYFTDLEQVSKLQLMLNYTTLFECLTSHVFSGTNPRHLPQAVPDIESRDLLRQVPDQNLIIVGHVDVERLQGEQRHRLEQGQGLQHQLLPLGGKAHAKDDAIALRAYGQASSEKALQRMSCDMPF